MAGLVSWIYSNVTSYNSNTTASAEPSGFSSIRILMGKRDYQGAAQELFKLNRNDFVKVWMYLMAPRQAEYVEVISRAEDIAKAKGMPFYNFLYLFKEKAEELWGKSNGSFDKAWSQVDAREIEVLNRDYKFLESLPWNQNSSVTSNSYATTSAVPVVSSVVRSLTEKREFPEAAKELFKLNREDFVKTWMYLTFSNDSHCDTVISNAQDIAQTEDRRTRQTSFLMVLQILQEDFKKASQGSYSVDEALGKVDVAGLRKLEDQHHFFASLPWKQ